MAFNLDDLAKQMLNGMKNVREASGAAPKPIPTLDETSRIQQRINSRKADIADSIDQVVNRTNLNEAATNYFNVGDTGRDNMMNNRRNEKQFINDMTARGYSKSEVKDFVKDYKNNNGNPVKAIPNKNDIDKFVDPNYRMTKYEEDNAKQLVDDYFKPGTKAYKLLKMSSSNANQASKIRNEMTEAERNEYDKMTALKNKTSNLASYTFGALNIVPFEDTAMNKMNEWMGGNPEYNYSAMKNSAKVQNPLAYTAGDMTSKLAAYNVLGNAIEGVPALGEATNALGKDMAFGNEIAGKAIGNILRGNMADLALDTIPTEIENYKNGMSAKDIAIDALKNEALNTAFNAFGEVPSLIKDINLKRILDAQDAYNANFTKQIEDLVANNTDDVANAPKIADDVDIDNIEWGRGGNLPRVGEEPSAIAKNEALNDLANDVKTVNDATNAPKTGVESSGSIGDIDSTGKKLSDSQRQFFKDSKAVDDNGNLMVMYHGSPNKFKEFDLNRPTINGRMLGDGVYFTPNKDTAKQWAKGDNKNIYKVYLDIKNPFYISDNIPASEDMINYAIEKGMSHPENIKSTADFYSFYGPEYARARGYDGAILKADENSDFYKLYGDQYLVFSADQIKSTRNTKIPVVSSETDEATSILSKENPVEEVAEQVAKEVPADADKIARYQRLLNDEDYLNSEAKRLAERDTAMGFDKDIDQAKMELEDLARRTLKEAETDNVAKEVPTPNKVMAEDIGLNPNTVLEDEIDDIAKQADEIVDGNNALKPQEDYNIIEETVDPDVNPNSVVDTTNMKERGYSKHIRGEGKMQMEDLPEGVAESFKDDPDLYIPLKNADTKAKAEYIYNNSPDREQSFRNMLERHDPASVPLGYKLSQDFAAQGDYDKATQILRDIDEQLTKSGQFSQAAVINMTKNNPMAALRWAEKEIDSLNRAGKKMFGDKWNNFKLTDEEIKAFGDVKPGDTKALTEIYDAIGTRLGKAYPVKMSEKLLELRRVGMLLNPRTHARNFLANVPMLPMRWMADRVEAVGQNIAHLINPNVQVTQSLRGAGIKGRKMANEVFKSDAVQNMIKGTSGKYEEGVKSALMENKQVFKGTALEKWLDNVSGKAFNKAAEVLHSSKRIDGGIQALNSKLYGKEGVQSTLETLRNTTYKLLDLGDSPFVKENFVERLGSYINAQGIKNIDEIPPEAIQTAWDAAMKATYKDNSWAVQMLSGLRGGIEKVPGIGKFMGQGAIPFLQAPGNIAARMVDYSAINGVKGIGDIIAGATKNNAKQITDGIEEFAKGATGSSLVLLGMKMREAGVITGDYSEDPDQKAQQKRDGFRPFAFHVGDKYFAYDWAQPAAEPLIIGTLLQETIENSDKYDSDILQALGYEGTGAGKAIGALKAGGKASVNSWFNASPLQGLSELMGGGNSNGETDIAQNVWDTTVSDFAGSFIPSVVNATAKTMDTTQRNTYDPTNKVKSFLYQQQAKIPGLSDELPAKYDTWGQEMTYANSNLESGLQRYLIPGEYGVDKHDEIDDEINRLFESTGNNAVFAPKASYSVGDMKLNNEQNSLYQRDMGQRNRELVEEFMDSDYYQSLSDEDRAEVLKNMYNVSRAITERDNFDRKISDNSSYKDAIEVYDRNGAAGLIDYYEDKAHKKEAKDTMGTSAEWAMDLYDSKDKSRLNKYKDAQKVAKKFGYDSLSEEEFLQYEKYGKDKLEQTLYYKESADKLGVSNNEMYRELVDNNVDPKYIKQAYNDITSMQCGVDEYDRPKYLDFDKTAVDIYYNYGEQGIQNYADIKSMGGNKDTYNAFMLYTARQPEYSNQIPALDPQQFMAQVDSIEQSYYKRNPDADGKPNGNISMKELLDYMTVNNFSQDLAQKYWNSFFDNGYTVSLTKKGKYHYTNPNKKKKK